MKRMLAVLMALWLCASSAALAQEPPALLEPVSVRVDTFTARTQTLYKTVMADAAVVPHVEELAFPQEGLISQVHVVIGQAVQAGDVLVTLNLEAEEEQLQQLQREISALEEDEDFHQRLYAIDMALLETELRQLQAQPLPDKTAIALKKLDMEQSRLEADMQSQLRTLQLGEKRAKAARLQQKLSHHALVAPFAGRVMHMADISRGAYVSAYTPLIFLADESRLHIRSSFIAGATLATAHDLYALIGAQRYEITPMEMDPQQYVATVLAGEDPATDFAFTPTDESITAGLYAAVCMERQWVENALVVPNNALYTGDNGRYLYVMENGVRVRREVETGVTNDIMTQVTHGLGEGEVVYVGE